MTPTTINAGMSRHRTPLIERASVVACAALALVVGACGSDATSPEGKRSGVEVSSEELSCQSDDDCSLVYINCLGCDRDAINRSATSQHRADWQELCDGFLGPYGECDAKQIVARCEQKACVVKESSEVATSVTTPHEIEVRSAYTECQSDDDCTSVETGCNGCCQRAAISESFVNDYQADKALLCTGFHDGKCDCNPISLVAVCEQGSCVAE